MPCNGPPSIRGSCSSPVWPSSSPCWRSTCSAMACVTRSIPGRVSSTFGSTLAARAVQPTRKGYSMKRRPAIAALAAATAFVLALTGCGSSTSTSSSSTKATPKFNAANGAIFNPSTKKGGTITYANSGDWDNLDPADTYYGYSWDFIRYYGRSLVMFKPAPGDQGTQLVPDLATSLGVPSDNAKTWTYHIRPGLKYSDGTTITTKDIKYDVERTLDKTVFPNGPTYFNDFLDLQGYTTPYKDNTPGKLGLKAIETPDDNTIIFHLA